MTVLAVDLGGTKTTLAHVEPDGTVLSRVKVPAARDAATTVSQIAGAVGDARGIGVIVPGIYTEANGTAWCPNLWGHEDVPLRDLLRGVARVPVVIDSDRAGHVLGEAWLGAARGLRDVVLVAIGTGIGVGILSGGRVIAGAHGVAGAAGWFALGPAWNDEYAAVGCWETESAGPGLARRLGVSDALAVVAAVRAGDAAAKAVLDRAARYTGMGVANLISVLNPEAVVLGGGVIQGAGDLMLDVVRAEARRWAQPIAFARCRIELTQLGEDAGLFGAAKLALDAQGS
jgi:glucokinase